MAEKKKRQRGKREKQMEELKAGRNGSFAQVGWMDGWLGGWWKISLSFILPPSSNDVATICSGCLLLVNPRTQVSAPDQILAGFYIPQGPPCVFIMFLKENVFIGKPGDMWYGHMVTITAGLVPEEDKRCVGWCKRQVGERRGEEENVSRKGWK